MHFYEIGIVREDCYERTVQFVEDTKPQWILDRADLQLQEFLCEWDRFWKHGEPEFTPVGDLAHVASAIYRKPPDRFLNMKPRDFIEPFRDRSNNQQLLDVFEMNTLAHNSNRSSVKAGELTPEVMRGIEKRYVAIQLARVRERKPNLQDLHDRTNRLLESSFSKISIFVENGAMNRLKAHRVEDLYTHQRWAGTAKLSESRQRDRDHAVVSLAYCDVFVTEDKELKKYCEQIRKECDFPLAKIVGCGEWIEFLRSGQSKL
jgi:hypothetical protein